MLMALRKKIRAKVLAMTQDFTGKISINILHTVLCQFYGVRDIEIPRRNYSIGIHVSTVFMNSAF